MRVGQHREPLVLVASADAPLAASVQRRLTAHGYSTAVAHSGDGCLRVATSLGPDLVLLDNRLAPRTDHLLRAHPRSRRARVLRLSPGALESFGTAAAAELTPAA
jgi:DNA-binding response OmpR family regulator